ncbi:hypothetical protein GDO81_000328 [Engystomops pustulosus]|uniref:OCIA domain-containing protein n=1 Tax=Engystomops pustulosus TaxID=76066 RepID=A0AAV7D770_ENGPU|nr:hypothetical protein GDO81_000328 [Engystomops pustulosus]KAG8591842.1 hypothetical protein GDO81_000328 [Engystomops pustulosus]
MASDPQQAAGQSTSSDPQKIPIRCPIPPEHRKQFTKIVKECNEESFWNRALPLSITSMIATQALIYTGYLSKNKRFGSLPKVALAGILGFAVGKISYALTCKRKFEKLGMHNLFETGAFDPAFFAQFDKQCPHICEECKKKCTMDKVQGAQPTTQSS